MKGHHRDTATPPVVRLPARLAHTAIAWFWLPVPPAAEGWMAFGAPAWT